MHLAVSGSQLEIELVHHRNLVMEVRTMVKVENSSVDEGLTHLVSSRGSYFIELNFSLLKLLVCSVCLRMQSLLYNVDSFINVIVDIVWVLF